MADRLVFRDDAGRELTTGDLQGFTGTVRWEVIGDYGVPDQAKQLISDSKQKHCPEYSAKN